MSGTRSLKLEVLLSAVDRVTGPLKSIMGGSKELTRVVRESKDALKGLEKQQGAIDRMKQLREQSKASSDALAASNKKLDDHRRQLGLTKNEQTAVAAKLKVAQRRYDDLNEALIKFPKLAGNYTSAIAKQKYELEELQKQHTRNVNTMRRAKDAIQLETRRIEENSQKRATLAERIRNTREQLTKAGVQTHQLAAREQELKASVTAATAALEKQQAKLDSLNKRQQRLHAARAGYDKQNAMRGQMAGAGVAMTATGAAIGAPIAKSVRDYVTFEDAMLGIARQVDGARDSSGKLTSVYHDMARQVKQLGRELPIPTNQIAEMVTAGARMEVPRGELIEFTRTVAMMATAFDAVPDEIAESMGKVAKNFKIPVTQIRALADTINYLDDNAISKGGDIIDVLNRISGVVSTVKMTDKAAAALASTLLTLGERPETAATAINAMVQKFAAAEKGTNKFKTSLKEIGLSAGAVQKGMAKDAMGTMFNIIEHIQKLPKDKRIGVMVELVGMEHSDTLAKLVDKPEELKRQLKLANGDAAKGSMEREFSARLETLSARWQMFTNRIFAADSTAGAKLRGELIQIMDTVGSLLDKAEAWMEANPALTASLMKWGAVAAVVVTAMGAITLALAAMLGPLVITRYGFALLGIRILGIGANATEAGSKVSRLSVLFTRIGNAATWIGSKFSTLRGALSSVLGFVGRFGMGLIRIITMTAGVVGRTMWLLSRLLLGTGIGLIITAIAALAYYLWSNWEVIGPKFWGLVDQIKQAFATGWEWIKSMAAATAQFVVSVFMNWSLMGIIYRHWDSIMAFMASLPSRFTQFGLNIMQGLVGGITNGLALVKSTIQGAGESTINWFKEKLGIHSPSRVFAQLGGWTMAGLDQGLANNQGGPLATIAGMAKGLIASASGITLPAPTITAPSSGPLDVVRGMAKQASAALAGLVLSGTAPAESVPIDTRPPVAARAPAAAAPASAGQYTINIYPTPGMDEKQLARLVVAELDKRERQKAARGRSKLTDND